MGWAGFPPPCRFTVSTPCPGTPTDPGADPEQARDPSRAVTLADRAKAAATHPVRASLNDAAAGVVKKVS
jgi:hypothetical protein